MNLLPPGTAAPHQLQAFLTLSDSELAQYDVASLNLACAIGLPGAENLDPEKCLRTLDEWAAQVEDATQRCPWFQQQPDRYDGSVNLFRIHVLVSTLQRHCGVRYNPERIPEEAALRVEDVFIHGVFQQGGTCASLPVVYTAVGRRLGYPLKLVSVPGHLFLRWDDPEGERFNIEINNCGFDNPSDDYYRQGRYPFTVQQERECGFLTSQTPRQELSGFLLQRGFCWLDLGEVEQALAAFAQAATLHPDSAVPQRCIAGVLEQQRRYQQSTVVFS